MAGAGAGWTDEILLSRAREEWAVKVRASVLAAAKEAQKAELARTSASRRARSTVRRKCLAIGADHLVTLTYRADVQERSHAVEDLQRFVRLVRSEVEGWAYVAVLERQKRGTLHWHIAVSGRQDVRMLRRLWWAIVGEGQGNIDVSGPRGWQRVGNSSLRVASYIAKYVGKGMSEDGMMREGKQKRYLCSQGIEVPAERFQASVNPVLTLEDWARLDGMKCGSLWTDGGNGFAMFWDEGEAPERS